MKKSKSYSLIRKKSFLSVLIAAIAFTGIPVNGYALAEEVYESETGRAAVEDAAAEAAAFEKTGTDETDVVEVNIGETGAVGGDIEVPGAGEAGIEIPGAGEVSIGEFSAGGGDIEVPGTGQAGIESFTAGEISIDGADEGAVIIEETSAGEMIIAEAGQPEVILPDIIDNEDVRSGEEAEIAEKAGDFENTGLDEGTGITEGSEEEAEEATEGNEAEADEAETEEAAEAGEIKAEDAAEESEEEAEEATEADEAETEDAAEAGKAEAEDAAEAGETEAEEAAEAGEEEAEEADEAETEDAAEGNDAETEYEVDGNASEIDNAAVWKGTERVSGLKAKSSVNGIILSWNAVAGADGYLIGAIRYGNPYRQIAYTSGRTYTDTNASLYLYNYYWVFPYKKVDGKVVKGRVSANYVYGIKLLPKPENVKAAAKTTSVYLRWDPVSGADGYVIKVRRGNGSVSTLATIKDREYSDINAPVDEISYYWVYAYKNYGDAKRPGEISSYVYAKAKPKRSGKETFPTLASLGLKNYGNTLDAKLDELLNGMIRDLEAAGYFFFDMSQIEQAYYIALFIGTHYFYGSGSYTAENMIDMHYGTCFAYSDLAFCMAKKTGIDAWLCVPGRPVEHNNR